MKTIRVDGITSIGAACCNVGSKKGCPLDVWRLFVASGVVRLWHRFVQVTSGWGHLIYCPQNVEAGDHSRGHGYILQVQIGHITHNTGVEWPKLNFKYIID